MDPGSVSTGYSDRPVARAIKIKHAGLNLTGPDPWSIQPGVVWEFIARTKTASGHLYRGLPDGPGISKLQASSVKLDSWSRI